MNEAPTISVVLPTYQHLRFLPAAIADIVAQTRADWELIVVDDGSTDGTAEWLASADLDPRIRRVRQDNAGPDAAINAGVALARGEYLTWVSADNRCAPYFLEALAAALDSDPGAAMAYSPYFAIDASDRIRAAKTDNLLLLRELVCGTPRGMAGFLYRRALHDSLGPYRGLACDTRMWAALAERHRSVFVLEPTYSYRFHDDRATLREPERIERERRQITTDFLLADRPQSAAELLRRLYPGLSAAPGHAAEAAADGATRLLRAGAPAVALDLACEGLRVAEPAALLPPLAGAVLAAMRAGLEPIDAVLPALLANPELSEAARDAALTVAAGLWALAGATGEAPSSPWLLDAMHPLCRLELPRTFSFAAWKAGQQSAPLPPF